MRPRVFLLASVGVAVLVGAWVLLSPNGMRRLRALREEEQTLQGEVQAVQRDNERLQDDVKVLRGDDAGSKLVLEKKAREELGYLAPGEIVLTVPANTAVAATAGTTTPAAKTVTPAVVDGGAP